MPLVTTLLHYYPIVPHPRYKSRLKPLNAVPQQLSVNPTTPNPTPKNNNDKVIIIGAGLAGLAAAARLQADRIPYTLLEASDSVGGRVRTDYYDGFTLDRGFQILITAYPEVRKLIDYDALELRRFYSGARVYFDGKFYNVADPLRHFGDAIVSLGNPIGTIWDKMLIALTRIRVLTRSDEEILTGDEVRTVDLLKKIGFSDAILHRFFKPFFGGVFFDGELETTSRLFDFVFKCLALGDNALPRKGISAIPDYLASKLDQDSIFFNSKVISLECESDDQAFVIGLENGETLTTNQGVILGIEQFETTKLLAGKVVAPNSTKKPVRSTTCLYFWTESENIPNKDPVLYLNGSGKGIVNNMFFPTNVSPSYASPGKALVSISLIGSYDDVSDEELVERVAKELSKWFGEKVVGTWRFLRMYRIGFAQPNQCPPTDLVKDPRVKCGLYVCGDYVTSATFDGALVSGRRAAEALLKDRAAVKV